MNRLLVVCFRHLKKGNSETNDKECHDYGHDLSSAGVEPLEENLQKGIAANSQQLKDQQPTTVVIMEQNVTGKMLGLCFPSEQDGLTENVVIWCN